MKESAARPRKTLKSAKISRHRPILGGLLAAPSLCAVVAAHLYVYPRGLAYAGPLLILDHLFDLLAVTALIAIAIAVGNYALSKVGLDLVHPIEALAFGAAVGVGLISTSFLVLGFLSGLHAPILAAALGLWALLARRELGELPRILRQARSELIASAGDRALLLFGLLVAAAATAFVLIMALAPPVDWDALTYHLQVPAHFLAEGRIYLPDDNLHTAYVGLVHMLYLPLLALGSTSGPALFSAVMALLLGLTAFSLAARLLDGRTASLALGLVWGTTTLLLVAITPRIDVTLALYLLLAHYALLLAASSPSQRDYFYLAALLLGFAFASKYHAVPYIVGLTPLILWLSVSGWERRAASARALSLFSLILLSAAVPWLLKNWVLLGAPLYPLLADNRLEPWLVTFYGTATVPSSVSPEIYHLLDAARLPFNLPAAFFSPGRLTIEFEGAFHYANPVLLLLPLWLFFLRKRTINWLIIPAIGYLLVLILPFGTTNLRYLIPASVPLTLAAVHMLVRTSERHLSIAMGRLLLVALAAIALVPSARTAYVWLRHTEALPYLIGATSGEEYMATHLDPGVRTLVPVVRFVNQRLPEGSRILMLYEARGFYFRRPVIEDTWVTNWPLLAHRLPRDRCLEQAGISHLLVNYGAVSYYLRRGVDPRLFQWQAFTDFADRCLGEPVFQDPAFLVFQSR